MFRTLRFMINELLVNLVNSVIGAGKRTARGNQAHNCPYCNHKKPKLEINFSENKKGYNPWHCWVCDKKGTRITSLFKQVKAAPEKFDELGYGIAISSNETIKIIENDYKNENCEFIPFKMLDDGFGTVL